MARRLRKWLYLNCHLLGCYARLCSQVEVVLPVLEKKKPWRIAAIVALRIQEMRKTTSDVTWVKDVEKNGGWWGAGVYSSLAHAPLNFKLDLKFISVLPSRFSGVLLMKRLIFTDSFY